MSSLRVGLIRDFRDEGWPSMDLCADQLLAHLEAGHGGVAVSEFGPPFVRLASRLPLVGRRNVAFNTDRLVNRQFILPRTIRRAANDVDFYHIVDHSYAHLVDALPAGRSGVYCHDLDAFRSVIGPEREPRPWWFRRIASRILAGLSGAAVVFCNTDHVRAQIVRHGLVDPERLVLAPLGVAPEFRPAGPEGAAPPRWLSELSGTPWVLHVGSCIPRKRIDVLLEVAAAARERLPGLRLVKVGGRWSRDDESRISRLGLGGAIVHVHGISRPELAQAYRRASALLQTSEAEGFGLPVAEALACGTRVVASDIPALREAGGPAATYAPVADVEAWTREVVEAVSRPDAAAERAGRLAWASKFSWPAHALTIAGAYMNLRERGRCAG